MELFKKIKNTIINGIGFSILGLIIGSIYGLSNLNKNEKDALLGLIFDDLNIAISKNLNNKEIKKILDRRFNQFFV